MEENEVWVDRLSCTRWRKKAETGKELTLKEGFRGYILSLGQQKAPKVW